MAKREFRRLSSRSDVLYQKMTWGEILRELEKKYPSQVYGDRLRVTENRQADLLILTPEASRELMDHFHWGIRHPNNVYEQQAGVAGYLFKDPETGRFIAVAEFVIPAIAKNRTPVGARLSVDDTADVQCELNVINQNLRSLPDYGVFTHRGEAQMLGMVHSHPNTLGVFLSPTDQETHRVMYGGGGDSLGISLVVNPHRRLARAFGGADIHEMEQLWFFHPGDYARFTGRPVPEPVYVEVPETGASFETGKPVKAVTGEQPARPVMPHPAADPVAAQQVSPEQDKKNQTNTEVASADIIGTGSAETAGAEGAGKTEERAVAAIGKAVNAGTDLLEEKIRQETGRSQAQEARQIHSHRNGTVYVAGPGMVAKDWNREAEENRNRAAKGYAASAGGAWSCKNSGIPGGQEKTNVIRCGDIVGSGSCHYNSVEEYQERRQACWEEEPQKPGMVRAVVQFFGFGRMG